MTDDLITCRHGHTAPRGRITSAYYEGGHLPVDQSEPSRHGCPICAYARGWEDGIKTIVESCVRQAGLRTFLRKTKSIIR